MALSKLALRPGVNAQSTLTQNEGGASRSNLIRWKGGSQAVPAQLEKVGGWKRLFPDACAGIVRAMHAYEDLNNANNLMLGTDGGAQIYVNGALHTADLAARSVDIPPGAIAATVGSATMTVTDPSHGRSVGNRVSFGLPYSVGGQVIYPQTVTVTAVPSANTWSFTAPYVAASTSSPGPPFFTSSTGSSLILVALAGHGLTAGQAFQVNFDVVYQTAGGVPVARTTAGSYPIVSVQNANNFTIDSGFVATGNGAGYEYKDDESTPLSYLGAPPPTPQNWFLDNFGQNGIFSFANAPIYEFKPPVPMSGGITLSRIANAPQINAGVFVAMPQAQIVAFGSEAIIGGGVQDPLLVRWCNVGDETSWLAGGPTATQAGSNRLSRGSRIIGGLQAPQSSLLWTDVDLWTMAYIGPPSVYSFTVVGSGCGLLAPKARAVQGRNTFWMGQRSFWIFGDSGVQPLPCDVWDQVFPVLDLANVRKCFAASNASLQEVSFFFPVIGGTGECSAYVKFNTQTGLWDYGQMPRSAWIDESVLGAPLGADLGLHIQQHEQGYDDDTGAMRGVFVQTGWSMLSEGDEIMFVDKLMPDMKWFGTGGSVNLTVFAANSPNDAPVMHGPYSLTATTKEIPLRVRARMVALRLDWAATPGFSARFGAPLVRTAPSGKVA